MLEALGTLNIFTGVNEMPKSLGGLVGWLVSTVVVVFVGLFIINKVGFLRNLLSGGGSA